jgi:hypothetical protein
MTFRGTVRNGTVVLEPGVELAEGQEVRVETAPTWMTNPFVEETSLDDAFEKLYLFYKIRRGLDQADASDTLSQEEARERLGFHGSPS